MQNEFENYLFITNLAKMSFKKHENGYEAQS